jgi:2'-5' RNA ligase
MLPPVHGYVVWLLLSKRDRKSVKEWQYKLRDEFPSPDFEPHLTLLRPAEQESEERLILDLHTFSEGQESLVLEIAAIDGSRSPYQSLYLDVALSEPLRKFRKELAESLNSEPGNSFNPHISLLYGAMSDSEREELRSVIKIEKNRSMTGSALALVSCDGTPDTWKFITRVKLSGKARFV